MRVIYRPIPAASLDRVAPRYEWEEEAFRFCIKAMDEAFLRLANTPEDERRVVQDKPLTTTSFKQMFNS